MWDGLTGRTHGMRVAVWLLMGLLACLVPTMAIGRPLTAFDLTVVGVGLEVGRFE